MSQEKGSYIGLREGSTQAPKQERYCNNSGSRDLIDHWADVKDTMQFRAIMIAQIEKYCSRYGKKDSHLTEIRKIVDYANRLLQYEEKL